MNMGLFVHHSSDTDFTERLSEDLHAKSVGVHCLAAEAEEDFPASSFDSREVFAHVFVLSAAFEQTTWFKWLDKWTEIPAPHLVLEDSSNDDSCGGCERIRPFAGGTTMMKCCLGCQGWSLALARYCEWCGAEM